MRFGFANGERVLIRYTPLSGAAPLASAARVQERRSGFASSALKARRSRPADRQRGAALGRPVMRLPLGDAPASARARRARRALAARRPRRAGRDATWCRRSSSSSRWNAAARAPPPGRADLRSEPGGRAPAGGRAAGRRRWPASPQVIGAGPGGDARAAERARLRLPRAARPERRSCAGSMLEAQRLRARRAASAASAPAASAAAGQPLAPPARRDLGRRAPGPRRPHPAASLVSPSRRPKIA